MTQIIEVDGRPFAVLIDAPDGSYLVPPIVINDEGNLVEGAEVLQAIVDSGVTVSMPTIRNATPADLAWIDQTLSRLSTDMGVPVGPPDEGGLPSWS